MVSTLLSKCYKYFQPKSDAKKKAKDILYSVYRPSLETQYRRRLYFVQTTIPRPSYIGLDIDEYVMLESIVSKVSPSSIDAIRNSAKVAKKTMKYVVENIAIGMTTNDIDHMIYKKIIQQNAYPSLYGYRNYVRSSFISPNNIANHGFPEYFKLSQSDIVTIDFAVFYQGIHIDIAETVMFGEVDDYGIALCNVAKQLTYDIINACKPGQNFDIIKKTVRNSLKNTHFSLIKEFCGHGIGKHLYQSPHIYFDGSPMVGVMEPGMMFTIEPILTEGKPIVQLWPNAVTYSTVDELRTAKFERTILITETGREILTDD